MGLQIGTDGFGIYAQGSMGKGSAHGNGITHTDSTVNADGTFNAQVGIVGAQEGAVGGGNQLHFNLPPEQRSEVFKVIGEGKLQ